MNETKVRPCRLLGEIITVVINDNYVKSFSDCNEEQAVKFAIRNYMFHTRSSKIENYKVLYSNLTSVNDIIKSLEGTNGKK